MRVTVFDHGAGNLHSLAKALAAAGAEPFITDEPAHLAGADAIVLPGVGAFAPAAARLVPAREAMRAALFSGTPALGICLGMQLLFEGSDEGEGVGLGVFAGRVTRVHAARVPHLGWNSLVETREPLLEQAPLDAVYYAHSYACRPTDTGCVTAWSELDGDRFPAIVRQGRVLGVQFHPEKSSLAGLAFLRAFLAEAMTCA
ncbi:MAG: imidazole glycerol phosphate synthase subunit HisH [Candidatus Eisenbacteria bacterium]